MKQVTITFELIETIIENAKSSNESISDKDLILLSIALSEEMTLQHLSQSKNLIKEYDEICDKYRIQSDFIFKHFPRLTIPRRFKNLFYGQNLYEQIENLYKRFHLYLITQISIEDLYELISMILDSILFNLEYLEQK